jgi:transcriptional regulator with GAF, ATPase, and Fis domain
MTPDQAKARAIRIAHTSAVPWAEVQGRSREAHIVAARWRIIAMLREGGCSIGTIARALSKDAATVRNALRRMGMMAPKNPLYTRQKAFYTPRP